jgi:hypothetical protein
MLNDHYLHGMTANPTPAGNSPKLSQFSKHSRVNNSRENPYLTLTDENPTNVNAGGKISALTDRLHGKTFELV